MDIRRGSKYHQTKIDCILSDSSNLVSGVVQGSGIGPLMFLVYINELIELLDKIGVKLIVKAFADYMKIYVRIINDIDCDVLQRALDSYNNGQTCGNSLYQ